MVRYFVLALFVFPLLVARPATAQEASAAQTTPDGRTVLISKDIGAERWAIALNPADGTVTGNVFRTDGSPPQFIWCERLGTIGDSVNPAEIEVEIDCFGTERCVSSPCLASAWNHIARIPIAGDFFLPARDPFVPFQAPDAYCHEWAWGPGIEGGEATFEIESADCNYLTVVQNSRLPIQQGDPLFLRAWHTSLTAPPDSESYMGIQIGDDLLWAARIPLPPGTSSSNPVPLKLFINGLNGVPENLSAPADAPAGTPIYFHFHNHGDNTYNLLELNRGGENGPSLIDHEAWERASIGVPGDED
ncbi:MAG: hypothetical protein VCC00_06585 [Deltaproteobacteria bacterium]